MKTSIKTGALTTMLLLAMMPSSLWSMQENEKIVTSYDQTEQKKQPTDSHQYMLGFALIVNMWSPENEAANSKNWPNPDVTTDKPTELYPEMGK